MKLTRQKADRLSIFVIVAVSAWALGVGMASIASAEEHDAAHRAGDAEGAKTLLYQDDEGMLVYQYANGDIEVTKPQKCGGATRIRRPPRSVPTIPAPTK